MSKRGGPIFIKELISKIDAQRPASHTITPVVSYDAEQGHSAYEFISKKYKSEEEKPVTKWEQTGNKPITELVTNQQQTDNKVVTIKPPNLETGNKLVSQPVTDSVTKWEQTGNKLVTKTPFSSLTGLQRAVIIFLYETCKFSQGKITDSLTLEHISSSLKTSSGSVKTTINRLEEKGAIIRMEFKNGRGGWSKYKLPESIFHEILQIESGNKLVTKWEQTGNKVVSQPVTELVTSPPSSSSFNLITNTTTTSPSENKLPPEWDEIDLSPLLEIGFSGAHIRQFIQRGKLTPEQVQDSINAFSFDLRKNQKIKEIKTTPIRYFMKILGNGEIYIPSENYMSPQEENIKLYVERKKKLQKEKDALEKVAADFAFKEWLQELSYQQRQELLAPVFKTSSEKTQEIALRNHFNDKVWSEKRFEIQNEINSVQQLLDMNEA